MTGLRRSGGDNRRMAVSMRLGLRFSPCSHARFAVCLPGGGLQMGDFRLAGCLKGIHFRIVLVLPFALVPFFRDTFGMRKLLQLDKVLPPLFFLFRRQVDPVKCLNLRLRRVRVVMFFGSGLTRQGGAGQNTGQQ